MFEYLLLALAPAVAFVLYIYYRDKNDREPLKDLVRAFIFGGICVIPAGLLEYRIGINSGNSLFGTAFSTFIVIAGAEEGCKFLFMRWAAWNKKAFNEPFDGIVYCVMVGMGFAAFENILYVFQADDPLQTAIMRMLTAVPAHFTFAVIMGYYVGLAKFNPANSTRYLIMGVGGAMLFHGLYDFFLMQEVIPYITTGAVFSLIIAWRLSFKAMKLQSENSRVFIEAQANAVSEPAATDKDHIM
jgi:RsiW-degrading membrane proteinase PrsW (M82 family)